MPYGTLMQGFLIRGDDFGQPLCGPGVQRGFLPLLPGAAAFPYFVEAFAFSQRERFPVFLEQCKTNFWRRGRKEYWMHNIL